MRKKVRSKKGGEEVSFPSKGVNLFVKAEGVIEI